MEVRLSGDGLGRPMASPDDIPEGRALVARAHPEGQILIAPEVIAERSIGQEVGLLT